MTVSPMMKQYKQIKQAHPRALLLFRMGDFYEMFYEDAECSARVLGLALTSRDKGLNPIPMAGFPHHALDNYLGKLIQAGHRVAICDQVEDARQAKGLVRREVTRVITAGTLTDENLLDPRESNFLAAIAPVNHQIGLAWVELSTGTFQVMDLNENDLSDELGRLNPAECLFPDEADPISINDFTFTVRPSWSFTSEHAQDTLLKHLGTSTLEGFDISENTPSICAAGALVEYLTETHKAGLTHITHIQPYHRQSTLKLDDSTRRSLEITRTMREGKREGSLLAVLDSTVTPMGARCLSDWLSNPLTDQQQIVSRHEAIDELIDNMDLINDFRDTLNSIYDLERLTARISSGRASPRDLGCVNKSLSLIPVIKSLLASRKSSLLTTIESHMDPCRSLFEQLEKALVESPPLLVTDGGIIRSGYHEKLDKWRELTRGGKQWIAEYQATETERTGIPSLKIGFNKVFGYYLEVTHTHIDKVPESYIRKQTLKNAERYITPELKEHEEKVLQAQERMQELEYQIFVELRERCNDFLYALQETGRQIAIIDVLISLAFVAKRNHYNRPEMVEEPTLEITDGRHPVLDIQQPDGEFVPNDVHMNEQSGQLLLVTGPNMAGKSTYIRQVALLTLMAQIGSFVPARAARIGISDRIFARVGASDELSRGQSTFMVEMVETARILNTATDRSLVILDEIGRGTSTYDGVSLAWAVTEHLHDQIQCRTLFATHYHELTALANSLPQIRNLNVAIREWQEEIIFLHKIIEGGADKSYGLHVARLAGVPRSVIERAKTILTTLESEQLEGIGPSKSQKSNMPVNLSGTASQKSEPLNTEVDSSPVQLSLFTPVEHPIAGELRKIDLDKITPFQALEMLNQWQQKLLEDDS